MGTSGILCKGLRPGVYSGKLLLHMKFWTVFFCTTVYNLIKVEKSFIANANRTFARKSLRSHKSWAPLTWRAPLHSALTFSHSDLLPHSFLENSSQPCVTLSRLLGPSLVPFSLKRFCFRCLSPPTPHSSKRSPSTTTSLLFKSLCPHICQQKDENIWKDHFQTKPVPTAWSALVH